MNLSAAHQLRRGNVRVLTGLLTAVLMAVTAMPVLGSGSFSKTGSMNVARASYTATLLSNGQVLVAGGGDVNGIALSSAELYNPTTGKWTFTGSMITARGDHEAVLLQSGELLVAGGNAGGTLASAELYNPSTGTWTATGSMNTAHEGFNLTLLPDGEALAVQGTGAELYNPATGLWTITGNPTDNVSGPSAPLLLDGQVLGIGQGIACSSVYNPSTGTWNATACAHAVINLMAALLPSGEVLALGGYTSGNTAVSQAYLYDPSTGQFTPQSGPCQCAAFGALLQTGEVLVAGGIIVVAGNPYPSNESIKSAELWDPSTQVWTSTGSLNGSREGESMTVLQNGQVLVVGGWQSSKSSNKLTLLSSAELYKP